MQRTFAAFSQSSCTRCVCKSISIIVMDIAERTSLALPAACIDCGPQSRRVARPQWHPLITMIVMCSVSCETDTLRRVSSVQWGLLQRFFCNKGGQGWQGLTFNSDMRLPIIPADRRHLLPHIADANAGILINYAATRFDAKF